MRLSNHRPGLFKKLNKIKQKSKELKMMGISTFNYDNFTWQPKYKTFSAYVSDLPRTQEPFTIDPVTKKPSLIIIGKSKIAVKYELYKTDKDGSGEDTYGWNFRPTAQSVKESPGCKGTEVLLIND
jgi:hypothetical protein